MVFPNFLFTFLPLAKYQVSGESMLPAYRPQAVVLVNKLAYLFHEPNPGDVVVLYDPRNYSAILKRIAKKNNQQFFVLGDNLSGSTDSREFGWVTRNAIIGKVTMTLSG